MDTKYQVHLRRPQRLRGTTGGCKMESQEGARSSYHEQHQDGSLQALPGGRHRTATRLPGGQHRTATHHTTHPKELILLCTRHTPVRLLSPQHWAQTCTESRIALQQVEGDGYADVRKGYAQEDQNRHAESAFSIESSAIDHKDSIFIVGLALECLRVLQNARRICILGRAGWKCSYDCDCCCRCAAIV
jgi:hypothetical protein